MPALGSRTLAAACWVGSIAVLALGAWLVCRAPNCAATDFDATLMAWFAQWRNETADGVFRAVTWFGSVVVLTPLVAVSILILTVHRRMREGYFLATALAGAILIMHVSKLMVARPRPADVSALVAMPWSQSFPSSHSAQIASVLLAGLLVVGRLDRRWVKRLLPVALLSVVLVGVSRVYLQVHYPSDVLIGIAVGGLWVAGLASLMLRRAN